MRKHVRLAAVLFGIAIVAVACGNNKKQEVSVPKGGLATKPPEAAAPVKLSGMVNNHGTKNIAGLDEVKLEADDFYFEPTFLGATPSQKVTIEVENEGQNTHNFSVTSLNISKDVQPGKSVMIEVSLPGSGVVNFFCRFHQSQGMQGAFYFPGHTSSSGSSGGASSPTATSTGASRY